jgi:hypothetical protein
MLYADWALLRRERFRDFSTRRDARRCITFLSLSLLRIFAPLHRCIPHLGASFA